MHTLYKPTIKALVKKKWRGKKKEVNTGQHVMSMDQCVWSHLTSAEQEQIVWAKQINLSHSHLTKTHLFTLRQKEEPPELKASLPSRSHVCTQRWISTVTEEVWATKTHSSTHGEPAIKQFTGCSYKTAGKHEDFTSAEENVSDQLYCLSIERLYCDSEYEQIRSF